MYSDIYRCKCCKQIFKISILNGHSMEEAICPSCGSDHIDYADGADMKKFEKNE